MKNKTNKLIVNTIAPKFIYKNKKGVIILPKTGISL